ncbi:hypothetical protein TNCT_407811 [Trichonephila clavata]|uniref:Uncharacterized protein n=1 Tax=Trichonephila clavata TaxID=2740835 RepID=A0A8X6KKX6_TRICU|nr:hypothetical protein TNCT_407811 [Trichonephila clavata]
MPVTPTRQRQSRNNQTPNQRNNFHQLLRQRTIPFQKPHSGAVLEPVYLKFEPFEPFSDEDSRHERIVKDASDKSSVATPESFEDETDEDSPDTHKPSTKTAMKSEQREEWVKAMSSEIETMHNRGVLHLEKLPEAISYFSKRCPAINTLLNAFTY